MQLTNNRSESDKTLFAKISEGNEAAFRELFHLYLPELRPLIYKLVKSALVVDDLVQDVFFKIWMSRDVLESIENPHSWIIKITFHECFDHLRKIAVRNRVADELASSINATVNADAALAYAETVKLVETAIEHLPPQAKKVYLMSRQEGLRMQQIAEKLGLSVQTVKNTMSRALKSLRCHLEKQGMIFPLALLWYCLK